MVNALRVLLAMGLILLKVNTKEQNELLNEFVKFRGLSGLSVASKC
ncbi:MAG UNVERIFIED_CONTAM: hypothetical protein LVR29_15830 [Microcystis novacekii LVE1205-3]